MIEMWYNDVFYSLSISHTHYYTHTRTCIHIVYIKRSFILFHTPTHPHTHTPTHPPTHTPTHHPRTGEHTHTHTHTHTVVVEANNSRVDVRARARAHTHTHTHSGGGGQRRQSGRRGGSEIPGWRGNIVCVCVCVCV